MKNYAVSLLIFLFFFPAGFAQSSWQGMSVDLTHGKLEVSDNRRFLVHENGTPFF